MLGQQITPALMDKVAQSVRSICDPAEDLRGDAEYKTAMAGEMTRRAIAAAVAHCQ
jgi:carbon-monoxide dehydrogenase medium subunit